MLFSECLEGDTVTQAVWGCFLAPCVKHVLAVFLAALRCDWKGTDRQLL